MACPFNEESLAQLKLFVNLCKSNLSVLHAPQLRFFREFLESLGGTIPEMPKPEETPQEKPPKAEAAPDSESESDLEFDDDGCVKPDELSGEQVMGDAEKQPTEEDVDKADEIRRSAMRELSEANYEKARALFTEAIEVNPQSAILYTKRGQCYINLQRPNACIKDCTHALDLNCDSAPAYKFRGRAHRLLGDWEKAAKDLRQACKIDFDEQADEWLKEVQPNALKIEQHKLKQERKKVEKEEKERLERLRKAREAHAKAAENQSNTASSGEMPGSGGPGMADFLGLMQDPEIQAAFQDPEVAAAFQDIVKNPANIMKYQSNPKVQGLINKLSGKFSQGGGGGMGFPGFGGGFPGMDAFAGAFGGGATPPSQDDGLD